MFDFNQRGVLVLGLALGVTAAYARTERGSFLNTPARTVPQLVAEVKSDAEVADRFMRHFGQTKGQIVQRFSKLHVAGLKETGIYLVYNIDTDGVVRHKALRFKKGTLVFANSQGEPILKMSCGNAMVAGTDFATADFALEFKDNPVLVPKMLPDAAPVDTPVMVEMVEPEVPADLGTADVAIVTPPPPPVVPTSHTNLGWLTAISGLAFIEHGHTPHNPPPVPEPVSGMVLLVGFGASAVARRRRGARR